MKARRSWRVLAPVLVVFGLMGAGCTLPTAGPVDKVIAISPTCNLEVRLGGDAAGSFVAARSAGICLGADQFEGTPSESMAGIRLETSTGVQQCVWFSAYGGNFGPGSCSEYQEGIPGQTLTNWYQATAPGAMVAAEILFAYYDAPTFFTIPVFP